MKDLRKQIINSLSTAQLEEVNVRGEAVIEAEADKLLALFNSNLKEEREGIEQIITEEFYTLEEIEKEYDINQEIIVTRNRIKNRLKK